MSESIANIAPHVVLPAQLKMNVIKVKQFAAETSAQVLTSMVSLGVFGALGIGFKLVGAVGATLSSMCTVQNMCRIPVALPTGKITSLFLNKLAKQPKPESSLSQVISIISASAAAIASSKFLKHKLGYSGIQDDAKTIALTTAIFFVFSNFLMTTTKYQKLQRELMDELDALEEPVAQPTNQNLMGVMTKTDSNESKG